MQCTFTRSVLQLPMNPKYNFFHTKRWILFCHFSSLDWKQGKNNNFLVNLHSYLEQCRFSSIQSLSSLSVSNFFLTSVSLKCIADDGIYRIFVCNLCTQCWQGRTWFRSELDSAVFFDFAVVFARYFLFSIFSFVVALSDICWRMDGKSWRYSRSKSQENRMCCCYSLCITSSLI